MNCFLIAAMTADGFIGRQKDDRSFTWTSAADKKFYIEKIKTAGAIVMGSRTFNNFDKYPPDSRWIIYTHQPEEFINPKPEVIEAEATNEPPKKLLARLEKEGLKNIAICGGSSIYTLFMQAGVVHTLYLTMEPVLFGQGVRLFKNKIEQDLTLVESKPLSVQTLLLTYRTR